MGLFRVVFLSLLFTTLWAEDRIFKQECVQYQESEHTVLRHISASQELLLVNSQSLQTSIHASKLFPHFSKCHPDSAYQNLRQRVLSEPKTVANRGMKKGFADGYAVTVDMCPSSKKGFELDFYEKLIKRGKAFPVTISMTKKWAIYHPKEFAQLKLWDDQKKLHITWMNHGTSHPYEPHIPIEKNFINLEGVDFKKEVLENESFLIKEGRVPSIFYRFAGLVSNEKVFNYLVKDLGLIPVGSLTWLAKGEKIQKGSIVLLHGNKNEPLGVNLFLESKSKLPVIELPQLFIQD